MGGAASRIANSALSMKRVIQVRKSPNQHSPVLPSSAPAPAPVAAAESDAAAGHTQRTVRPPRIASGNVEWFVAVLGFCFTALGTAAQCLQTLQKPHQGLPVTYYSFCFALILTLITLVLSKYIPCDFHSQCMLNQFSVLCGIVAFFIVNTLPFPLWLKLTTWACFALSLVVVLISYWFLHGGN